MYKRQIYNEADLKKIASDLKEQVNNMFSISRVGYSIVISAVSYTHLDVYKRQVLCYEGTIRRFHIRCVKKRYEATKNIR